MTSKSQERILWALAAVTVVASLFQPMDNPDLFWHMTAGRWILERHAVPRADFMTFTKAGAPWVDYEWLSAVIYQTLQAIGGFRLLWIFKVLLLWASWLCLNDALKTQGVAPRGRAASLIFWSVTLFPQADIRPDHFSMFFFCLLIAFMERCRRGFSELTASRLLGLGVLFAFWADLHPGFFFGWFILAAYAAEDLWAGRRKEFARKAGGLAAAILGTFANPYGVGIHRAILEHTWTSREFLAINVSEWHALYPAGPQYWKIRAGVISAFILFGAGLAFVLWRRRKSLNSPPLIGAAAVLGGSTVAHGRILEFTVSAAAAACDLSAEWLRPVLAGALVCLTVAVVHTARARPWGGPFDADFLPAGAVRIMEDNAPVFQPLRVYTPWGWGGYLIWKLRPWYRAYWGSRVLLHADLIPRVVRAVKDPLEWNRFMDEENLDAALFSSGALLESPSALGSGGPVIEDSWFVPYFPAKRWALVYWDAMSRLLVRRDRVPAPWLARHEYRCFWPEGIVPPEGSHPPGACAGAERRRHTAELAAAPTCRWLGSCL